jgi:MgtE intracellular N domain
MMKVIVFFVGSLVGGLALGAVGRGFMIDPPAVEEESAEGAELDAGLEIVEGQPGTEHGAGVDPTEPAAGTDDEGADQGADHDATGQDPDASGPEAAVDEGGGGQAPDSGSDTPVDTSSVPEGAPASTQEGPDEPGTDLRTGTSGAGADAESDSLAQKRLADIFGSMDAEAAAEVLVELSDTEVTDILGHLSARKAGEVIKNMPPGRAATLSRAMLDRSGGEP